MAGVLKSSLEVTNAYYFNAKKRNYHFANEIANEVGNLNSNKAIEKKLKDKTIRAHGVEGKREGEEKAPVKLPFIVIIIDGIVDVIILATYAWRYCPT